MVPCIIFHLVWRKKGTSNFWTKFENFGQCEARRLLGGSVIHIRDVMTSNIRNICSIYSSSLNYLLVLWLIVARYIPGMVFFKHHRMGTGRKLMVYILLPYGNILWVLNRLYVQNKHTCYIPSYSVFHNAILSLVFFWKKW